MNIYDWGYFFKSHHHNQVIDRDFKGLDSLLMGIFGKILVSNSDFFHVDLVLLNVIISNLFFMLGRT